MTCVSVSVVVTCVSVGVTVVTCVSVSVTVVTLIVFPSVLDVNLDEITNLVTASFGETPHAKYDVS